MYKGKSIVALIPALNEELVIADVIEGIRQINVEGNLLVDDIVVANNNSSDRTAEIAAGTNVTRPCENVMSAGQSRQNIAKKRSLEALNENIVRNNISRLLGARRVSIMDDTNSIFEPYFNAEWPNGIVFTQPVTVVTETEIGYGATCLKGLSVIEQADIVVFVDGDGTFNNDDISLVCQACSGSVDMVIGSRKTGHIVAGSMSFPQRFGTALACKLIWWRFKVKVTDLGPLRAIRFDQLKALNMTDRRYGWTTEMQVKAILQGMNIVEIPVTSNKRKAGRSKISGTFKGVLFAGWDILRTVIFTR